MKEIEADKEFLQTVKKVYGLECSRACQEIAVKFPEKSPSDVLNEAVVKTYPDEMALDPKEIALLRFTSR